MLDFFITLKNASNNGLYLEVIIILDNWTSILEYSVIYLLRLNEYPLIDHSIYLFIFYIKNF